MPPKKPMSKEDREAESKARTASKAKMRQFQAENRINAMDVIETQQNQPGNEVAGSSSSNPGASAEEEQLVGAVGPEVATEQKPSEPVGPFSANSEVPPVFKIEEEQPAQVSGLFVPDGSSPSTPGKHTTFSQPSINVINPDGVPGSNRGTPDFGRWTPAQEDEAQEDEGNLFTPSQARTEAGLETDGNIVAWAIQGRSKPVIVGYGPRNARKYMRSTAYRESDFLDEENTVKFGPKHRLGDKKVDDVLVRKTHEFKGILGVAFNCTVDELVPKPKVDKEKGKPRGATYPRVEVWVQWEICGKKCRSWETRTSIKHLFRSFCDLYIYQAAVHSENQYNAWKTGNRPSEDRSPTPAPRPWLSPTPSTPSPATAVPIKKEKQLAVNLTSIPNAASTSATPPLAPGMQTRLSPLQAYKEDWCELNGVDPKNMSAGDKAVFLGDWQGVKQSRG